MMRTPKLGDVYQVCVHLENSSPSVERHNWWRLPGEAMDHALCGMSWPILRSFLG